MQGRRGVALDVADNRSIARGKAAREASVRCLAADPGQKNIRVNAISAQWNECNALMHRLDAPDNALSNSLDKE